MTRVDTSKSDRALELYERGITRAIIAERLGVRDSYVQAMIQSARKRREKAGEVVG